MPLDHLALYVSLPGLDALILWLTTSGTALNLRELARPTPQLVALGESEPWLWIFGDAEMDRMPEGWKMPHIGLVAKDAEAVRKWHAAAIQAGGEDNGAPGPRPMFGPRYYAAFVRDPVLGINFEAVCKTWSPSGEQEGDAGRQ